MACLPPNPTSRNIPACLLTIPGVEKLTLEGARFSLMDDGGWSFNRTLVYLHFTASPSSPIEAVMTALDAMPCCERGMFSDDLITLHRDRAGNVVIDGPCRITVQVRDGEWCEGCPRTARPEVKPSAHKTPEDVKREFAERGISVADWARERGFPPYRVYDVLNRRSECTRGLAHTIAVELGIFPLSV